MSEQMDLHMDEFVFHMRDGILKKLQADKGFREMSQEVDKLAEKYPVIPELFEGKNTEHICELTPEERAAIGKYAQMRYEMHDMVEWEHYIRGHRDSMLLMNRCGFFDRAGMTIQ